MCTVGVEGGMVSCVRGIVSHERWCSCWSVHRNIHKHRICKEDSTIIIMTVLRAFESCMQTGTQLI